MMEQPNQITQKRPFVSVIVPVYNSAKVIERMLDSLVAQTEKNIEIIVIDDGSTDESGPILEKYASRYEMISVFHQPNSGVSAARNRGIQKASGKFLMFADADDYVHPDMVRISLAEQEKKDYDLIIFGYDMIRHCNNKEVRNCVNFSDAEYTDSQKIREDLFEIIARGINSPCNKLYRKRVISQNEIYFDEALQQGEDFNFNLEYLLHVESLKGIPDSLYYYEVDYGSSTTVYRADYFERRLKALEKMTQTLERFSIENNIYDWMLLKSIYGSIFHLQLPGCRDSFRDKINKISSYQKQWKSLRKRSLSGVVPSGLAVLLMLPGGCLYLLCSLLNIIRKALPSRMKGVSV